MIDIHTHMLPAIDDGAADRGEAMLMVEQASAAGVKGIIFTPHMNCSKQRLSCEETKKAFKDFAEEVKAAGIPVEMWLGGEVKCSFENVRDVIEDLKSGELLTVHDTGYVLIEMDYDIDYDDMFNAVRELVRERFRPVMAHVERYECLFKKSDRIRELVHQGAYIQINAEALMGGRLNRQKRWCERLLCDGLVHFVSTDCHDEKVRRPAELAEARDVLIDIIGKEGACEILEINPQLMLNGEYID